MRMSKIRAALRGGAGALMLTAVAFGGTIIDTRCRIGPVVSTTSPTCLLTTYRAQASANASASQNFLDMSAGITTYAYIRFSAFPIGTPEWWADQQAHIAEVAEATIQMSYQVYFPGSSGPGSFSAQVQGGRASLGEQHSAARWASGMWTIGSEVFDVESLGYPSYINGVVVDLAMPLTVSLYLNAHSDVWNNYTQTSAQIMSNLSNLVFRDANGAQIAVVMTPEPNTAALLGVVLFGWYLRRCSLDLRR